MVRRSAADGGAEGGEHLARHLNDLAHRLARDLDLGEADRRRGRAAARVELVVPSRVIRKVWNVRVGNVQRLSRRGVGRRRQVRNASGCLPSKVSVTAETQRDRSPRWGCTSVMWSAVTGMTELRLPPLAGRVGQERPGDPGGVEVAVDGAVGLVLGGVRDRVAVAAGGDVDRAHVGGHGLASSRRCAGRARPGCRSGPSWPGCRSGVSV